MTHLRKMMLEELQRRNCAQTTIGSYIRIVEDFSQLFQRSPDHLGPKHIREYQSELFTKRKYAASTVTVYLAVLRFFYTKMLKRAWSTAETPYPKRTFSLPTILRE
ncbi:MAG TPA: site-specific integrase [Candidatus Acidoferrum sp.]